jgi:hypothetical protein
MTDEGIWKEVVVAKSRNIQEFARMAEKDHEKVSYDSP